ncbi:hypothetical protein ACFLQV_01620 [Calditrichota bacterium]
MPRTFKKNIWYYLGGTGHMYSRIQELKDYRDIDILFLGSSHAYRGFDTRIFAEHGLTTFNLGSSNQTPVHAKILLEHHLESLNPRLVIYEVFPHGFKIEGIECTLDLIANDRIDASVIKLALKEKDIRVINTLIYGIYRQILGKNARYVEPVYKHGNRYIKGGFVEKDLEYFTGKPYPESKITLREDQLSAFEDAIKMIEAQGGQVLLVLAPVTDDYYKTVLNWDEFDALMRGYGEYYNFNDIMDIEDTQFFYDSNHLNSEGVPLFNEEMIRLIKENQLLSMQDDN